MKTLFRQFLAVFIIATSLEACSNDVIYKNITQLNYGTSFGECVGYCKHEVTIKSKAATYKCSSWNPTVQTLTKDTILNSSILDSIGSFNTNTFFKLPETIGCPDCADGGAEWLEIILPNGDKHKVTFEYQHEPASIHDQIIKLREILNKNECK
jgi:hypothetical protein